MENICQRFPHLRKVVLNNLDNQSLITCKGAIRDVSEFLENERFFWIRILKRYQRHFNEFKESWKVLINKTSLEMVKHLALSTLQYFKIYPLINPYNQLAPINIAVELNNVDLCKFIYEKTRNHKNPKDIHGMTPLHYAAMRGSFELCKLMLENIAMKNPVDNWGDTPLHYAVNYNRFEICQLFIDNIKDIPIYNGLNWETAKNYARSLGHNKILKLLKDKNMEFRVMK